MDNKYIVKSLILQRDRSRLLKDNNNYILLVFRTSKNSLLIRLNKSNKLTVIIINTQLIM